VLQVSYPDLCQITANWLPHAESKVGIHCNLPSTPNMFDPAIHTSTDIPNMEGLVFPFVNELALPDAATVPTVVANYFMGFLSNDSRSAAENFQKILRDWGVIMATPMGHILSHLYWVMGFAFRTQTTVRIIIQPAYGGCVLLGAGYRLIIGDRTLSAKPYSDLLTGFDSASPHRSALVNIFAQLPYTDPGERDIAMRSTQSMQGLKAILMFRPLSADQRSLVMTQARKLRFLQDPLPSIPNAANISAALTLISTNGPISGLHLPSSQLFCENRTELIWSQFGNAQAPSFQVEGGKVQDFAKRMIHKQKKDQNNSASELVTMPTRRLGIIMVPLARATRDIQQTLTSTTISNPFASAMMGRVSSKSTIKTFEGNAFDDIIVALRKAANVMEPTVEEGSSKRPREDDDDEGESARAKRVQGFEL
jgi:hypothetical protein